MAEINVLRGNYSSRDITLKTDDFSNLPDSFKVIFTVKPTLDDDLTDSKAIIQKQLNYPDDFEEDSDGNWVGNLIFTQNDTTHKAGKYVWNIRFLDVSNNFIADSVNGDFNISLRATQTQTGV